jgi:flagellum-specific peptidoglycan hydrolase FlgJ
MACGVTIITGVAPSDLDNTIALLMVDQPTKTTTEPDGHGEWNVTCYFTLCNDGSDPLTTATAADPGTKTRIGSAATTPAAFIAAHLADAQAVKKNFRIPIAVTLAQSALETGWGRSVVGNAYFGIKALPGQPYVTSATHEYDAEGACTSQSANFCSFSSYTDAAMAYGNFLTSNARYADAFNHTDNPETFALAVAAAGYATDPNYGNSLVALMRVDNLEGYDRV